MRFFDLVLQRPAVTLAALIATVALGARALIGLGSSVDQGVGRPAIGITVRYSGALPVDVERAVVRPIERRVAGLDGIVRTEATAREGVGRVVLYFDYLRHLEDAFQPVHDSVGAVRSELPPGAEAPVVAQIDPSRERAVVRLGDDTGRPGAPLAGLGFAMFEGALLALLTIFCAIRSWRSALIVSLVVGVSTLAMFEVMSLAGVSLGATTLLAVALSLMFFIDDAVTVRESIVRQTELGLALPTAAARGTISVVPGLAVAALSTLAVFGLIAMAGGYSARWFGGIAVVVIAAVGVSLAVSSIAIPALSSLLPRRRRADGPIGSPWLGRLECWFERVAERHHDMLAWSLDRRRTVGAIAVGFLAVVALAQVWALATIRAPHPIELDVRGPDAHELLGVAQHVADDLRQTPGAREVFTSLAAGDDGDGITEIDHVDGERVVRVRTIIDGLSASDVVKHIDARLAAIPLPPGYHVRQAGEMAERADSLKRLSRAFAMGLGLIALLLGLRFRSVLEPLTVLLAVPIVIGGVLAGLLAAGASLDLLPLVAAAFAAILVVRQSALLLAAARERRAQDLNDRVSVIAAGRSRLRPTLLSTVAMIAAIVPVAVASGGAAGLHRALVIALISGIVTSSAVSLLVVPTLYATLEDAASVLATRYRARLARRERRVRTLPRADDEGVMSS